jgi:hypothetical protein
MLFFKNGIMCFVIALLLISSGLFFIFFGSSLSIQRKYSIDISWTLRYFFAKKVMGLMNNTINNRFHHRFPRNSCRENPTLPVVDAAEISVIITIAGSI